MQNNDQKINTGFTRLRSKYCRPYSSLKALREDLLSSFVFSFRLLAEFIPYSCTTEVPVFLMSTGAFSQILKATFLSWHMALSIFKQQKFLESLCFESLSDFLFSLQLEKALQIKPTRWSPYLKVCWAVWYKHNHIHGSDTIFTGIQGLRPAVLRRQGYF